MTTMTLVDYADSQDYSGEALRSDQSLFVPIFCKECYGTTEEDHTEALCVVACGSNKYIVGVCSVFGVAEGEAYPDSRKDFMVANDMSYSGACHPQPGKVVFLHKVKMTIGQVKCYWHAHSRSVNKTFLYCCVTCDDNKYTNGVVTPDMSMGFSLGTVGDNDIGPITEECSLVSVPMRPGCFCTLLTGKDVAQTMTRMGFSTLKESVLDAGINLKRNIERLHQSQNETSSEMSGDDNYEERSVMETIKLLRKAMLDQAVEVRVLKDVLEAVKVQNSVLAQRLKCPDDPDTFFMVEGAKDFTRRTRVQTKLCAGIKPTDEDINLGGTEATGYTHPEPEHMADMAVIHTQIDNLIKLLQQQQPTRVEQQQPGHLQQMPTLEALQSFMQIVPILQQFIQPHTQHPYNPQLSGTSTCGDTSVQYGTLTAEPKRKIAIEYNKEESERQVVSQREQEKMLDSIKASISDVMLEQQDSTVSQGSLSSFKSNMDMLQSLARDTPYKRVSKQAKGDQGISALMNELRELTKQILKCDNSSEESREVMMETENVGTPTSSGETHQSPSPMQQSTNTVVTKQQAGYVLPLDRGSSLTSQSVSDFISAVVTKI